jgi:hypothetical protein
MASGNGASTSVRPMAETRSPTRNGGAAETGKPDFQLALDQALAALDNMMGPRQRAAAIANARREILVAFAAAVKTEKRKIVAALTPAQLRKEVRELLDSHEALLDYIDDLERQPVIAGEVRRLRRSGAIPWPL